MVGRVPFAQQQGLHVVKQRGGLQPWLTGTLNLDSRELHPRWVFFQDAPPEFCQTFWGWFGSSRTLFEAIFSISGRGDWPLRIWNAQCGCNTYGHGERNAWSQFPGCSRVVHFPLLDLTRIDSGIPDGHNSPFYCPEAEGRFKFRQLSNPAPVWLPDQCAGACLWRLLGFPSGSTLFWAP